MKKPVTNDLPEVTAKQLGRWIYQEAKRISEETGESVMEVITDIRDEVERLEKELAPEVERLMAQGYPPRLAKKISAGFHPNSPDPIIESCHRRQRS